jgi:hypothetical protein
LRTPLTESGNVSARFPFGVPVTGGIVRVDGPRAKSIAIDALEGVTMAAIGD